MQSAQKKKRPRGRLCPFGCQRPSISARRRQPERICSGRNRAKAAEERAVKKAKEAEERAKQRPKKKELPEDVQKRMQYKARVWQLTNAQDLSSVPNIHLREWCKYDLDHIISIYDGYYMGIPAEVISSIGNLRIIPHDDNTSKGKASHWHELCPKWAKKNKVSVPDTPPPASGRIGLSQHVT